LEKKALFDAVIGVVGVLGNCRDGGGLRSRWTASCSLEEEPFPRLGIFRGPKLIGGRLSGWRLFLLDGVAGFSVSIFVLGMKELFLALGLR
jgi:hypothetical protein